MSVVLLAVGILAFAVLLSLQQRRIAELQRTRPEVPDSEDCRTFAHELIEAIPSPIFYKGRDGRYLGCNSAFAEYLGRPSDQIVGRTVYDLSPKELADRYAAADAALFAQTGTQVYEVKVQWADGSQRDVVMHKATFAGADGTVRGLIGVITDITERKRAEEQVHRLKDELERRVLERTAQLAASNVELTRARDTAEAASRAKSVFLANMSHELRTPLNAILGFAQLLERDDRIPDDSRQQIATIGRSGNHLLALINDVLEISRIEAGRMTVQTEAFDIGAVLDAVEEMIRVRTEAKGLTLTIARPADLPPYAVGDAPHLRQVLLNLLGNAVKYTDHGQVDLRIRCEDDNRIRFEVADTGAGIPPDEQESIFQAFYQTETGVRKGEGAGLGLTISREVVRRMGGDLKVASEPGKGSTFSFAIPLPAADAVPYAGGGPRIVGLAPEQVPPRILVAEDHKDNQEVVEQLLSHIGCQVRVAGDGRQAVDLFRSWRPDLILMDIRMPVMDGIAATRAIRALPEGGTLPIVALTASAFEEDRNLILAAGCNELVRKPVKEERLFAVIGRMLGLRYRHAPSGVESALPKAAPDLTVLPAAVRLELATAARALDFEAVQAIVERLRPEHPGEAGVIAHLLAGFRFTTIEELCQQS